LRREKGPVQPSQLGGGRRGEFRLEKKSSVRLPLRGGGELPTTSLRKSTAKVRRGNSSGRRKRENINLQFQRRQTGGIVVKAL